MLAGRRLFKGETDVETFKQVQAAQVPDIRQLRPEVSANLVQGAQLALSPAIPRALRSRPTTSRAISSAVTLGLGQAVTYLDLRGLVEATARERSKRKSRREGHRQDHRRSDHRRDPRLLRGRRAPPSSTPSRARSATEDSPPRAAPSRTRASGCSATASSFPVRSRKSSPTTWSPLRRRPPASAAVARRSAALARDARHSAATAVPEPRAPAPAPPSAGGARGPRREEGREARSWRRWFGG